MIRLATIQDLERRYRRLKDKQETELADVLLEDAENFVKTLCARAGVDLKDEINQCNARLVICSIVKRALMGQEHAGAKTVQQMAGAFSEMITYQSSSGEFYLTKQEKRLLGIKRGRIKTLAPNLQHSELNTGEADER